MKKILFVLAVAFSASLYSCDGNKQAETTEAPVEEAAVVEEVVETVDTTVAPVDSTATEAPAAE